jgi:hypothetical protein
MTPGGGLGSFALAALIALGQTAIGDDVITSLPAPVVDYATARSGACLVMKLQGDKGLTIYDARSSKLNRITLPVDDFTFGAGGEKVVVFLKQPNEIQSWSLKTLEMVKSKEFADPINVLRIVMGHSRDDLALLRISRGSEELSPAANQVLNVSTLSIVRTKGPQAIATGHNSSFRDYVHHRASGDLSQITEWCTSHSPSGIGFYTLTAEGQLESRYSHTSAGYLAMGDDGLIYSGAGAIFDPSATPVRPMILEMPARAQVDGASVIPGLGGLFFIGVDNQGMLRVYQTGSNPPQSLGLLGKFPEWDSLVAARNGRLAGAGDRKVPPGMVEQFTSNPLTLDKRLLFAPADGFLLFLPPPGNKVIRRPFNFKQFLDSTEKDYLLVKNQAPLQGRAGQSWRYAIDALAKYEPVSFRLETAPEGMTLSHDGVLDWKIPAGIEGTAKVDVSIRDSRSTTIHHKFNISFH